MGPSALSDPNKPLPTALLVPADEPAGTSLQPYQRPVMTPHFGHRHNEGWLRSSNTIPPALSGTGSSSSVAPSRRIASPASAAAAVADAELAATVLLVKSGHHQYYRQRGVLIELKYRSITCDYHFSSYLI
jgi:hypothetical protein